MLRISVTSKLDGIRSWSLQALETCPGSLENGKLVDACSGCYATQGNYRYHNVKAPRIENAIDWNRPEWVDDMIKELNKDRYFRWFDSGDAYSLELAEKIHEVMARTPWVKHWLPTRMAKFPKFRKILDAMKNLENVSVRFSSDSVTGVYVKGRHGSVIIPSDATMDSSVSVCEAYKNNGKCSGCRNCWNKSIETIAYPAHGKSMLKVIRLKAI